MIRTGSAEFSQAMLARWKQVTNGGMSRGGVLHNRAGTPVPTPEESDVFVACRAVWIPPNERVSASAVRSSV
jgi:hypothetical protein